MSLGTMDKASDLWCKVNSSETKAIVIQSFKKIAGLDIYIIWEGHKYHNEQEQKY